MQRLGVICLVLFAIALGAAYVLRPEWFGQVEGSCAVARKTLTKLLRNNSEFHWVLERACLHLTAKPDAN